MCSLKASVLTPRLFAIFPERKLQTTLIPFTQLPNEGSHYAQGQTASLLALTLGLLSACGSNTNQGSLPTPQAATVASAHYQDTQVTINPTAMDFGKRLEAASLEKTGKHGNTLFRTEQGNVEFFKKELIVEVHDQEAFQKFLKKYDGKVLDDGELPKITLSGAEKGNRLREVPDGIWQLVEVNVPDVSLDKVAQRLNKLGVKGKVEFPDQESANLYYAAMVSVEEGGINAGANYAMRPQAASGSDPNHILSNGTYMTTYSPTWYNDALRRTQVPRAWEEFGVTGYLPDVAIIDTGFKPNDWELTGYDPVTGTQAYYKGTIANQQYDYPEGDTDVTSYDGDPDPNGSTWHGHSVAQVALGAGKNHYGNTGIAPGAWPYLYRLGRGVGNALSFYDAGRAVDQAIASGVDIINMSFGALTPGGAGVPNTYLGDALHRSDNAGLINVAAAGNDNRYQDSTRYPWFLYPIPASWSQVIAVGAADPLDRRVAPENGYGWGSNWGPMVDIWAPGTNLYVGPQPNYWCYNDSNQFCKGTGYENIAYAFNGTSGAAPFVAGAIALMRDANFYLNRNDVMNILRSTSNKNTPDSNVNQTGGRIDVYEAVKKAKNYVRP